MESPIFYDISYCFVEDLGFVGKKVTSNVSFVIVIGKKNAINGQLMDQLQKTFLLLFNTKFYYKNKTFVLFFATLFSTI